ncbi:Beta-ribofuranosylaminobenzene 5'-phosphate synthase family (fragment) [Crenothrix polyspora]|uniref:Beta-ribofuranosylaminobenzene 5'-phosphate synthase family n=1 Tax=Crenothrix polyspora TaxID=360316 RepID=A0A1R4H8Q2_9GAMM
MCYLLLMQGLPAVAENNISQFGEVITQLQGSVGEHFAPVQGGVFASGKVAKVMHWLKQQGAVAIGQTSWGPTGFCAVDNVDFAEQLVNEARQRFANYDKLSFSIASARNSGGEIRLI